MVMSPGVGSVAGRLSAFRETGGLKASGYRSCAALMRLVGERVGADLELHQLALGALAAFDVPHEVGAVVRVEPATPPARLGIIDTAVETA